MVTYSLYVLYTPLHTHTYMYLCVSRWGHACLRLNVKRASQIGKPMRRFLIFYEDTKATDACCVRTLGLWAQTKSHPHFGNADCSLQGRMYWS